MLTKQQRLNAYEKALSMYTADKFFEDGICVALGDAHWGDYMKSPIVTWSTTEKYFPELGNQGNPFPNKSSSYTDTEKNTRRILWLENAIMQLTEQPIESL